MLKIYKTWKSLQTGALLDWLAAAVKAAMKPQPSCPPHTKVGLSGVERGHSWVLFMGKTLAYCNVQWRLGGKNSVLAMRQFKYKTCSKGTEATREKGDKEHWNLKEFTLLQKSNWIGLVMWQRAPELRAPELRASEYRNRLKNNFIKCLPSSTIQGEDMDDTFQKKIAIFQRGIK